MVLTRVPPQSIANQNITPNAFPGQQQFFVVFVRTAGSASQRTARTSAVLQQHDFKCEGSVEGNEHNFALECTLRPTRNLHFQSLEAPTNQVGRVRPSRLGDFLVVLLSLRRGANISAD
eukprot:3367573-Amphidinium_carterae.1